MVINKRQLILFTIIALTSIVIISAIFVGCNTAVTASTTKSSPPTIVIDAGHGGEDGGAVASDGTNEKNINLKIAEKLNSFFLSGGYKTEMIRTDDTAIYDKNTESIKSKKVSDMHNRLKIFNKNSNRVIISIHQNKFEQEKYSGTQIFYSPNNENSRLLAKNIQSSVTGMLQPDNTRENKKADKNIYLLYNCTNPSVIVECGFISNPSELKKLKTDEYQTQMAFSIFCGCLEYISNSSNKAIT